MRAELGESQSISIMNDFDSRVYFIIIYFNDCNTSVYKGFQI